VDGPNPLKMYRYRRPGGPDRGIISATYLPALSKIATLESYLSSKGSISDGGIR